MALRTNDKEDDGQPLTHEPIGKRVQELFINPPLNHRVERLFGLYFYPQLERHIHRQSFRADLHRLILSQNYNKLASHQF